MWQECYQQHSTLNYVCSAKVSYVFDVTKTVSKHWIGMCVFSEHMLSQSEPFQRIPLKDFY